MHTLLIEDDFDLSEAISEFLELKGIQCDFAYSGDVGIEMVEASHYDLIILDVMLPNKSGFEVAQTLREQGFHTPIIMLTACDTLEDELNGFEQGIDDYVSKPCSMPLLYARMKALHERSSPKVNYLSIGDLEIFYSEYIVKRANKVLKLTPTGWRLFELLAKRSPDVVSKLELQEYAWESYDVDANTFNVQMHKLRKAIDGSHDKKYIHTIHGVGIALRDTETTS